MIPRFQITQWQQKAPWQFSEQIEQDLILSRILVELYSFPIFRDAVLFRGGTALHKLFLSPASRYSEDLDFVQRVPGPIGSLMSEIRKLDAWLGTPKWKQTKGPCHFLLQFYDRGCSKR